MENSAEALKMAAAVMVFVMALSLAIMVFSQARATSDVVLYTADETSRYDYEDYQKNGKANEERIVGMETVIPTLYKYSKEKYRVVFQKCKYNAENGEFIGSPTPLIMYNTETNKDYWSTSYKGSKKDGILESYSYTLNGGETAISVFDVDEEIARNEPWTASASNKENQYTKNITAMLSGGEYTRPDGTGTINYANCKLPILKNNNAKFVERIGRIAKSASNKNQTTTKTVITYVLMINE